VNELIDSKVLVRSEESGGVLSVTEERVPPGWEGPPPDDAVFDEAVYVLDGELTLRLGEESMHAGPGALAFVPAGVRHTWAGAGGADARYLIVRTPGTVEPGGARARVVEEVPGRIKVLLRGGDSAGTVAVMDNAVPAGTAGPPLHHHDFDEAFYILDGELTFQLGEEVFTRGAGELAFARRGAHHTFANPSDADARMVLICTPAGFDRYFQSIAARAAGVDPPPEALEPWPEVTVVGPQIGRRVRPPGSARASRSPRGRRRRRRSR
jgi:quercetin dioxygenase-like cupin family protein